MNVTMEKLVVEHDHGTHLEGKSNGDDDDVHEVSLIDTLTSRWTIDIPTVQVSNHWTWIENPPKKLYAFLGIEDLFYPWRSPSNSIAWGLETVGCRYIRVCTHHIYFEDDVNLSANQNAVWFLSWRMWCWRKLLDIGIIYSIAINKWASLIQLVPQKTWCYGGENVNDELISFHVTTSWRVYIDYRKLNASMKKDHFSPSSLHWSNLGEGSQSLFWLLLDGYLGCNQIEVAHENQKKTTFICPLVIAFTYQLCNAPGTYSR